MKWGFQSTEGGERRGRGLKDGGSAVPVTGLRLLCRPLMRDAGANQKAFFTRCFPWKHSGLLVDDRALNFTFSNIQHFPLSHLGRYGL